MPHSSSAAAYTSKKRTNLKEKLKKASEARDRNDRTVDYGESVASTKGGGKKKGRAAGGGSKGGGGSGSSKGRGGGGAAGLSSSDEDETDMMDAAAGLGRSDVLDIRVRGGTLAEDVGEVYDAVRSDDEAGSDGRDDKTMVRCYVNERTNKRAS